MTPVRRLLVLTATILVPVSMPDRHQILAADGVVHAVLFYSPTCGHCHYVMTEVLPLLFDTYGDRLDILGIDTSHPQGQALFQAAAEWLRLPQERLGVPMLIVGSEVFVGSLEIPERLPGLIEQHLSRGGVDWPAIPGLPDLLAAMPPRPTQEGAATTPETPTPQAASPQPALSVVPPANQAAGAAALIGRLAIDPLGSAMAVAVLVGLLAVLACSVPALRRGPPSAESLRGRRGRALLVLCVVGAVVAGYLAYVETARVEAVCGPVGDCNTVQQSEYARLFGTVPIAWLGLIGYLLIVLAWAVGAHATGTASARARLSLPALSAAGTLFSIYLTFLEPFVIGAVCLWCLTSAVVMGVLLWLTASPARARSFPEASSFREGHRV